MASHRLYCFSILLCFAILVNCETILVDERYKNIGLVQIINNSRFSDNISIECKAQLEIVSKNPNGIFLTMADAWSKFPYSGVFYRTKADLGNFEECLSVDYNHTDGQRIIGKHCAGGFIIPTTINMSEIADTAIKLSYCVPGGCTPADLGHLTFIPEVLFNDMFCTTKNDNSELDSGADHTLSVFAVIVGLMVISTTYELYITKNNKAPSKPVYIAFSLITNGNKLFKTSKGSSDEVRCFHGIKFISMIWIIALHGAVSWEGLPVVNEESAKNWTKNRYSQYIFTAHFAVDSFFFISGFLLSYLYFKREVYKPLMDQIKAVPKKILHRYLRLTPTLMMIYLYFTYLSRFVGSGPVFKTYTNSLVQPCKDHWWSVFLYIQNYYNRKELCMTQLWYVSADMQMFLFAPLVILPMAVQFRRHYRSVMVQLLILNLIFVGLPIFTKLYFKDYDPDYLEYDSHSRLIDYYVGVMFGIYIRHEKHKSIKLNSVLNIFLWALTLIGMFGIILVTEETNLHHGYTAKALCYSFTRPLWCIGLCWIVFSCVNGQGGVINWILSSGLMQIGGRLSYCMYLVHGAIIGIWTLTVRDQLYFSDFEVFYAWCGHFIVSILVSIFWTLAFELPMITIEKWLFGGLEHQKIKITHKTPHED